MDHIRTALKHIKPFLYSLLTSTAKGSAFFSLGVTVTDVDSHPVSMEPTGVRTWSSVEEPTGAEGCCSYQDISPGISDFGWLVIREAGREEKEQRKEGSKGGREEGKEGWKEGMEG